MQVRKYSLEKYIQEKVNINFRQIVYYPAQASATKENCHETTSVVPGYKIIFNLRKVK